MDDGCNFGGWKNTWERNHSLAKLLTYTIFMIFLLKIERPPIPESFKATESFSSMVIATKFTIKGLEWLLSE